VQFRFTVTAAAVEGASLCALLRAPPVPVGSPAGAPLAGASSTGESSSPLTPPSVLPLAAPLLAMERANCTAEAPLVSVTSLMPREGVVVGEVEIEDVPVREAVDVAVSVGLGRAEVGALLLGGAVLLPVGVAARVPLGEGDCVPPPTKPPKPYPPSPVEVGRVGVGVAGNVKE
jgi:hypothetical protein